MGPLAARRIATAHKNLIRGDMEQARTRFPLGSESLMARLVGHLETLLAALEAEEKGR